MSDKELRDKLARQPQRALVAFAARCARRVQPLTKDLPSKDREAVERAIRVAEDFARGEIIVDAEAAIADADEVVFGALTPAAAAFSARAAAKTAALADAAFTARARAAAFDAAKASAAYSFRATDIWNDTEKLNTLNLGQPGTLGDPIDPSEDGPLGSLWPNGAPDWYTNPPSEAMASAESSPDRLVLEAYIDESADTEEVADALAKLGYALNAYHIASGGNGLVIDDWEIRVPAPEPVGVKS